MKETKGSRRGRVVVFAAVAVTSLVAFAALGGVELAQSAVGLAQYQYGKKVTICHKGKHTIRISVRAWPSHKRHGDEQGRCDVKKHQKKHQKHHEKGHAGKQRGDAGRQQGSSGKKQGNAEHVREAGGQKAEGDGNRSGHGNGESKGNEHGNGKSGGNGNGRGKGNGK